MILQNYIKGNDIAMEKPLCIADNKSWLNIVSDNTDNPQYTQSKNGLLQRTGKFDNIVETYS